MLRSSDQRNMRGQAWTSISKTFERYQFVLNYDAQLIPSELRFLCSRLLSSTSLRPLFLICASLLAFTLLERWKDKLPQIAGKFIFDC